MQYRLYGAQPTEERLFSLLEAFCTCVPERLSLLFSMPFAEEEYNISA